MKIEGVYGRYEAVPTDRGTIEIRCVEGWWPRFETEIVGLVPEAAEYVIAVFETGISQGRKNPHGRPRSNDR